MSSCLALSFGNKSSISSVVPGNQIIPRNTGPGQAMDAFSRDLPCPNNCRKQQKILGTLRYGTARP